MSTHALPTALAEIVDDFQALTEPERLQLLLEFSRGLPELPERLGTTRSCSSRWSSASRRCS